MQSWWYGRLGKQEIVGPSRLILPTLPIACSMAHHCQLLWAWDGCLRGQVEDMDFSARCYIYYLYEGVCFAN